MGHVNRSRGVVITLILAFVLAACGGDDGTGGPDGADGGTEDGQAVQTGAGVTEEPCEEAPTGSEDRGCIYLGQLSDLTEGPFAALAVQITAGMESFWDRVNANGGIGGAYDVDVRTYTRDNKYEAEEHNAQYLEIEPEILALAQSLGTPPTLGSIDDYEADDMVGVAVTWWSGWEFQPHLLQSGYNYCIESMNAIDWAIENHDAGSVMAVHYPGDYGGDSAAGVAHGAEATGIEMLGQIETLPNEQAGSQDSVVAEILQEQPDLVVVATGPGEFGEIVQKSVAQGFEGRFIGSIPTVFVGAAVKGEAGEIFQQHVNVMAPWAPWGGDTAAHQAAQEAFGEGSPENYGWIAGWVWSYPLLSVLQQAYDSGDLTRAAVVAAVDEVTVDYEEALPDKQYSGDANETVVRESLVLQPDPDAPDGFSVLEDFFAGPTAQDYDFTEPCQAL